MSCELRFSSTITLTSGMGQAKESTPAPPQLNKQREVDWIAVLFAIHVHLLAMYSIWLVCQEFKLVTLLFTFFLVFLGVLGMTAGAHRLWAHQTYQASYGLRVTLMLLQTMAGLGPIYDWVSYHRLHHAHYGTVGDPYDHVKGFTYSHLLAHISKLSPYQESLKDQIDMSDVEKDEVVMFQKKVYWLLYGVLFALLPINAPIEYWGESVIYTLFTVMVLRYLLLVHLTWLIDSGVEIWGLKPGEKYPHDTNSVFFLSRTFWPHYHYLVPYDYKSGEYGTYDAGLVTAFIKVCAALGQATNLRTVETKTIQNALALAAKTKRPVQDCVAEMVKQQTLHPEHYLNGSR